MLVTISLDGDVVQRLWRYFRSCSRPPGLPHAAVVGTAGGEWGSQSGQTADRFAATHSSSGSERAGKSKAQDPLIGLTGCRVSRHISELSELLSLEQEAAVQLRELIVELRELVVTPAEAGKNFLRGLLADDVKASETIGLSPSITCGKKFVTIPLIIEGKHMMSLTVWKSDIVRIGYVPPGAIEGSRSGAQAITDSIHIHTKEMPRDDLGLVTPKRNYAPLLECLDQD